LVFAAAVVDALNLVAQKLLEFGRQLGLGAACGAAARLQKSQQLLAGGHQFFG
jgi:hypothetical protein